MRFVRPLLLALACLAMLLPGATEAQARGGKGKVKVAKSAKSKLIKARTNRTATRKQKAKARAKSSRSPRNNHLRRQARRSARPARIAGSRASARPATGAAARWRGVSSSGGSVFRNPVAAGALKSSSARPARAPVVARNTAPPPTTDRKRKSSRPSKQVTRQAQRPTRSASSAKPATTFNPFGGAETHNPFN